MYRSKVGALIKLYDVPASQLWIGAVAIGLRYSYENAPAGSMFPAILALVAITLVFFYVMSVNDYFDVDVDAAKKERGVLVKGEISMNLARLAIGLVAFGGLALAYLVSLQFFAFTLIIFILSSLYSIPPVRYKRFYPFSTVGEIAGAFVLFLLGYSVVGLPTITALFISTVTTLVATSARLRQEARNQEFDKLSGKRTLAVVHGAKLVKAISRSLLVVALAEILALRFLGFFSGSSSVLAGLFVISPILVKQVHDRSYLRATTLLWGFAIYFVALLLPNF